MNSKQPLELKDKETSFGFIVGEIAIYKSEYVKIIGFPTKWSALIISKTAIGDAVGEEETLNLISILKLKPISNEKR